MNLSVVIPCSKDPRLVACLQSLPPDVEIVVVLNNNPSRLVIDAVESDVRCKAVYHNEPGCNLARVCNVGISAASHDKVLMIDSDCKVPATLPKSACDALDSCEVAKARVEFSANTFGEQLVANVRRLHHEVFRNGSNLYTPGLAFRKGIVDKIGGYFFDEEMGWGEDGDLSERIHAAGICVTYLEEMLKHAPEGVKHDLKIAFRIGRGERRLDQQEGISVLRRLVSDLANTFIDRRYRFRMTFKEEGLTSAAYFVLWKAVNRLGYYFKARKETWP